MSGSRRCVRTTSADRRWGLDSSPSWACRQGIAWGSRASRSVYRGRPRYRLVRSAAIRRAYRVLMATSALRARGSIVAALIAAVVVAAACAPAPAPSAATTEPTLASLLPSPSCERAGRKRRADRRHDARAGRSPRLCRHGRTPGPRRLHDLAHRCRRGYRAHLRGRDRRVWLPSLVAGREAPRDDAGRRDRPRDRDHRPDVPVRAARGKRGHLREHHRPAVLPVLAAGLGDGVVPCAGNGRPLAAHRARGRERAARRVRPSLHHPQRQPVLLRLDRLGPVAGSHRVGARGIPRRVRARRRRAGWRARRAGRLPVAGHQPRRRARGCRSRGHRRRRQAGLPAPHHPREARRRTRRSDAGDRAGRVGLRPHRIPARRDRRRRALRGRARDPDRTDSGDGSRAQRRRGPCSMARSWASGGRRMARRSPRFASRPSTASRRSAWCSSTSPAATSVPSRSSGRRSDFIEQVLPYFDQYALSHRLWAPDSSSFLLPILDADGTSRVLAVTPDGEVLARLDGAMAFWSQ